MEKSKTVLVFMPSTGNFAILRQAGVWRVARSLGWRMHTAVYSVRPGCRYRLRRSPSGGSLHELFEFWKPDACIVDCGGEANAIPSREFGSVPTPRPTSFSRMPNRFTKSMKLYLTRRIGHGAGGAILPPTFASRAGMARYAYASTSRTTSMRQIPTNH